MDQRKVGSLSDEECLREADKRGGLALERGSNGLKNKGDFRSYDRL